MEDFRGVMEIATAGPQHGIKELPAGWRWARLLEVAERMLTGTQYDRLSYKQGGKVPVVDQSEQNYIGYHNDKPGVFASEEQPVVTFANHTCAVRLHNTPFSTIQNVFPLRGKVGTDTQFLYWLLKGRIPPSFYGGHWPKLVAIDLPFPPLSEQKRIAAILNEQVAAVEQARAAAEAQLEAAKALPAAYLRGVFESVEAQTWPKKHVWDLCQRIDYGFTASADFTARGPRFLRITDIQNGCVDWEKVPGCQITPDEESTNRLTDGDIVFARTGATTGKSFLIRRPPRAVFASYLIRLRPTDEVAADYLYAFFQSDGYWKQIRASARGGAQPNVNASLLGAITVPIPSSFDQKRVVAVLGDQMAVAERTRNTLEGQLDTINKLPAALLRKAFSGEL